MQFYHRWQNDEVSLQHVLDGSALRKRGYAKLERCCKLALQDNLAYVWIDTCCIDKSSSAELTEAINSMYTFYQRATVCYAYLFDVEMEGAEDLSDSAWWTRGWTLQELIAPSRVEFYNSSWNFVGRKDSMNTKISAITGIDITALLGEDLEHFSIAKRMSWASKRTTTRVEDMAYCLLGIFGVNMPLLYGEGQKAFIRLQEEILKQSDDQSLFSWSYPNPSHGYRGLLARSPSYFATCSNMVSSSVKLCRTPYLVTNKGLSIELLMVPWAMETYLALLDCEMNGSTQKRGIFLRQLRGEYQYARVMVDNIDIMEFPSFLLSEGVYIQVYVRQQVWNLTPFMDRLYGFVVQSINSTKTPGSTTAAVGAHKLVHVYLWHGRSERKIFEMPMGPRYSKIGATAAILWYLSSDNQYSVLKLGVDLWFNPVCFLDGPLWNSSADVSLDTRLDFELLLEPSWLQNSDARKHTGFRGKGLCVYSGSGVVTMEEIHESQRMLVVYIEAHNLETPLVKPSDSLESFIAALEILPLQLMLPNISHKSFHTSLAPFISQGNFPWQAANSAVTQWKHVECDGLCQKVGNCPSSHSPFRKCCTDR